MYARIVTFRIDGTTHDEYVGQATAIAAAFNGWDGLTAKFWLGDEAAGRYGGVYLFADKASADASRATAEFAALESSPVLSELSIQEFEILPTPTSITGGLWASVAAGTAA